MVRIYSIIAAFVAVTLGLVLLQPSLEEEVASAPRPIEAVSRDAVNLLDTVEPAPLDALVAQALTEAIGAPQQPDTDTPTGAQPAAATATGATAPAKDLEAMTWATLGNLQRATGQSRQQGERGSLLYHLVQRSLTESLNTSDPYAASLRAEAASY
ncbi:hypothetical protein [Lentibacter sp.]|uniref:hypothetical protein n=1 Tax=Lentibacter sp. TaxID=2024994 RepID=UPI003F6D2988